tara:strand:+ start:277 stop:627 length:351 start_codon:yes stop_codon:yes gene_type:complete
MKKRYIWILLLFLGCKNGEKVEFVLVNKTNFNIDSCYVEIRNQNLNKKMVKIDYLDSSDYSINIINLKGDGDFRLGYWINGVENFNHFGYFTNGSINSNKIRVEIYQDNLLIDDIP